MTNLKQISKAQISAFTCWLLLSKLSVVELLRQPTYVLTTLIFPSMFFWFFGVPNAQDRESARMLMGSFSAFAVLGVVLFQMTVAVAQDRAGHWSLYLRSLPIPSYLFLLAHLTASLLLAGLAVLLVIVTAVSNCDVGFTAWELAEFVALTLVLGFPFAALGMVLGSVTSPKSSVPVANLVYLPLSFAGGLWIPPNALSSSVQKISEYLPTRFYGEVIWAYVRPAETLTPTMLKWGEGFFIEARWLWGLGFYSAIFFILAIFLHRRDVGARFG